VFGRDSRVDTHDAFREGHLCSRASVLGGTAVEKPRRELPHQVTRLRRVSSAHQERQVLAGGGSEARSDTGLLGRGAEEGCSAVSGGGTKPREQRWELDGSSAAGAAETK